MSDIKLGELISVPLSNVIPRRDAVHVPIMAVNAGEDLKPGDRIWICSGTTAYKANGTNAVGIVDPFLLPDTVVRRGLPFWVLIIPKTVVNLSHLWSHPNIEDARLEEPYYDDGCSSMGCD